MTITFHLKPELEAGLQSQAQSQGLDLESYLLTLVEGAVMSRKNDNSKSESTARQDAVRRMLEFGEKHIFVSQNRLKRISQSQADE
jgi:hypothetical protein